MGSEGGGDEGQLKRGEREKKRGTEGGGGEEGLGNNPALDITLPPEAF